MVVRTVTGTVVCPTGDETTTDSLVSPARRGSVIDTEAVAVAPGAMVNEEGLTVAALSYRQVVASHWTVPLVPMPPFKAPFCSVKNRAVH